MQQVFPDNPLPNLRVPSSTPRAQIPPFLPPPPTPALPSYPIDEQNSIGENDFKNSFAYLLKVFDKNGIKTPQKTMKTFAPASLENYVPMFAFLLAVRPIAASVVKDSSY